MLELKIKIYLFLKQFIKIFSPKPKVIKRLEQEIGFTLTKYMDTYSCNANYRINFRQQVIELDLSGYELTKFPNALFFLIELQKLYLPDNSIEKIPKMLKNLRKLQVLDLQHNELKVLPEAIGQLQNLEELNAWSNNIRELPMSIGQLKGLKKINLGSNQLIKLPKNLGELENLEELILYGNQLNTLPENIKYLKKSCLISVHENPLEIPPLEIAEKGIEAIRNYFEQLEQGQDTIYEAKILIIGEGGAGKTSLANKLIDANYQLQESEPSTEGIDILQWRFQFEQDKTFQVNLWDFGGQEIYHATHQFFLTNRSLYILVADTRKENTDFFYWLQIVELLADKSPVIIIKNEKDDRQCEVKEENELRGLFKNFQCTQATNLATNRGLETIQTELKHQLQKLPHVGTKLPKTWADVRKTLENDKRHYIDYKTFLTICDENGFKKRQDKDQLAQFLHDLGVCLYFKDDPLLRKTVILKPEWGTDAVYKVLDNQTVKNNQGQFTKQDLADIWRECSISLTFIANNPTYLYKLTI